MDVPALVFNSYPRLRPTARNKMFNSILVWAAFDYREPTGQAVNARGRRINADLFASLFRGRHEPDTTAKETGGGQFIVKWAKADHRDVLTFLRGVSWEQRLSPLAAEVQFLEGKGGPIDSWLVVAPQVHGQGGEWKCGSQTFLCIERSRPDSTNRFGVFSSPEHVRFAKWLVGRGESGFSAANLKPEPRVGVLLVYPTQIKKKPPFDVPAIGFALTLPASGNTKRIAFRVRDDSDPHAVVVDGKGRK
jgi:hypothetical protein